MPEFPYHIPVAVKRTSGGGLEMRFNQIPHVGQVCAGVTSPHGADAVVATCRLPGQTWCRLACV